MPVHLHVLDAVDDELDVAVEHLRTLCGVREPKQEVWLARIEG